MKVGLFIPCYINAIYPNVGVASYRLLKSLGVDVDYPLDQTCCGQPMANAGFEDESMKLALRFDDLFREYDYIVGPSASYKTNTAPDGAYTDTFRPDQDFQKQFFRYHPAR